VTDNGGQPTTFKYDGDTNRVVKKGAGGETLYINPWYVAALGRNSKQVFAGTTRIATKLEISPTGEGYGPGAKNLKEVAQYFYHQDHLGSTGFATDATGEVWQHLEYFPFGETWVDEVSDDLRVPYRFTGQELDQETKLYYFGARYYDPKTSAWQSPDPALRKALNTKSAGNRFDPRNLNTFGYASQNPLAFVDPDGQESMKLTNTFWYGAGGFVGGWAVGSTAGVVGGLACGPGAPVCSTAGGASLGTAGAAIGGSGGLVIGFGVDLKNYIMQNSAADEEAVPLPIPLTQTQTQTRAEQGDYVYRALRADENPAVGLFAKDMAGTRSMRDHVRLGSGEGFESQFISTTRDQSVAIDKYAKGDASRVVRIDLKKLVTPYYDVSGGLPGAKPADPTNNFARADKEVLIYQYVPPTAITPAQ
jgi:RHS repeat-associated protein